MSRCFAVIGAPGSGKSTLVDRLCQLEGATPPPQPSGPEARIAHFKYLDDDWTAIDCPGSIEFLQDSVNALMVADAAVICVSSDPADAVLAAPYLRAVEAAGTPAILFINKIDEAQGRVRDIVSALQDYANHVMILRQIPIRDGENVVGAVDLISERAWKYREGEPSSLIEIPEDASDREAEAREELLEHLSDFNDWLLEQIIEDKELATGPVFTISARALEENKAIPALIGSAEHANGMVRLIKALRHEAPSPKALRERLGAAVGSNDPVLAVSFAAKHRKHVGRMVYLRSLMEDLKSGTPLAGDTVGSLVDPGSERGGAVASLDQGGVGAAVKSDHLEACRLYTKSKALNPPDWASPPSGQVAEVITPANERDDVKLSVALSKLAADDHALTITQEPESGAQVVHVQGPLHLRTIRDRLTEVFGVETAESAVPPIFRETITRKSDVHYRHRKQSGGAGQFADVKMTVQPNDRGAGFAFDEIVKGGAVPRNYIPAVEHGAEEAMSRGPLGFPVVDVKVTLTDGQHHSVDSSDMAFRIAGKMGVVQALSEATPVLLQPIFEVTFHLPSIFSGAMVPIVSSLHGQVLGFDRHPSAKGWDEFRALLPGSALEGLAGQLRSATQGTGSFDAKFDHYQELYGKEADKISEQRLAAVAH